MTSQLPIFGVCFTAVSQEKDTENGAAVTSLKCPSYFVGTLAFNQHSSGL